MLQGLVVAFVCSRKSSEGFCGVFVCEAHHLPRQLVQQAPRRARCTCGCPQQPLQRGQPLLVGVAAIHAARAQSQWCLLSEIFYVAA